MAAQVTDRSPADGATGVGSPATLEATLNLSTNGTADVSFMVYDTLTYDQDFNTTENRKYAVYADDEYLFMPCSLGDPDDYIVCAYHMDNLTLAYHDYNIYHITAIDRNGYDDEFFTATQNGFYYWINATTGETIDMQGPGFGPLDYRMDTTDMLVDDEYMYEARDYRDKDWSGDKSDYITNYTCVTAHGKYELLSPQPMPYIWDEPDNITTSLAQTDTHVYASSWDGSVYAYSKDTMSLDQEVPTDGGLLHSVAHAGSSIYTADNRSVYVFDDSAYTMTRNFTPGFTIEVMWADEAYLYVSGTDGRFRTYHRTTYERVYSDQGHADPTDIYSHGDDTYVLYRKYGLDIYTNSRPIETYVGVAGSTTLSTTLAGSSNSTVAWSVRTENTTTSTTEPVWTFTYAYDELIDVRTCPSTKRLVMVLIIGLITATSLVVGGLTLGPPFLTLLGGLMTAWIGFYIAPCSSGIGGILMGLGVVAVVASVTWRTDPTGI